MGKTVLGVFFGLMMVVAGASTAFALQAGGVEIGDLETGSVVGQSFKELDVDAQLFAVEIGDMKTWYPPVTVIDFKVRPGRPVLLKVTNKSTADHGFEMTDATNIGIPTSDMFYATQGNTLTYRCHLHPGHVGGKLLMIK